MHRDCSFSSAKQRLDTLSASDMAPKGNEKTSSDITLLRQLERDLYNEGFDIFHSFHPKWYNDSLKRDNLHQELMLLPETGRGYLIGNTKHLWPSFKAWYAMQPPCIQDPLDTYCREFIEKSLQKYYPPTAFKIFWESKRETDILVSMQRVASVSGFAYHDPITQLTVHSAYGTWHSYRAIVIIHDDDDDDEAQETETAPPTPVPRLLSKQEEECAREVMRRALQVSDTKNLCPQLHGGMEDPNIASVCTAWIAMRDCIERGRKEYRFDEDQLMYHYTKDVKFLRNIDAL